MQASMLARDAIRRVFFSEEKVSNQGRRGLESLESRARCATIAWKELRPTSGRAYESISK